MFEQIALIVDQFLSPLLFLKSHLVILILSILIVVILSLLNYFIGGKRFKEMREKTAKIREKINIAQKEGDREKAEEFMREIVEISKEYFKTIFKLLLISFAIFLIFVPWFYYKFGYKPVAFLPFSLPFIKNNLNWILWYLLISFGIAWILKKLLEGE